MLDSSTSSFAVRDLRQRIFNIGAKKTWIVFLLFMVALLLVNLAINTFVLTKGIYLSFYSERYSDEKLKQIVTLIENENKLLSYSIIIIAYSLKIFIISIFVYTGVFLMDIKTSLVLIFRAVIFGEFIFLIPSLMLLVKFIFLVPEYSLTDVQDFSPLSLLSLFNARGLDNWMMFLLRMFNCFQILYVAVIAKVLARQLKLTIWKSLAIVSLTYGLVFLFWLAFVIFLFINFS